MINRKLLIEKAFDAQKFCYTPYSKFNVGAALLCSNGDIYTGCNIENAAFTPTNCAERTAFSACCIHRAGDRVQIAPVCRHGSHSRTLLGSASRVGLYWTE